MLRSAIDYLSNVCNRSILRPDHGWKESKDNEKTTYTRYDGTKLEYFDDDDPFIVAMRGEEVLPVLTIRLFRPNKKLLDYIRSTSNFWDTKQGEKVFIYPDTDKISIF